MNESKRTYCRHCHKRIARSLASSEWIHVLTGRRDCVLTAEPETEQ